MRRAVAAGFALVLCGGVALAVSFTVGNTGKARPKLSEGSSAEKPSTRATVDSIATIVANSASDRSRVIAAIDEVQSCSLSASTGESTLQSVINDRRTSVARLDNFVAARDPGVSPLMLNDLLTTLNAAISDDVSYMSWMGDVASGHASCGTDPMSDPNFSAAKAESDRTNLDKQVFVDAWNPVAAKYGKPTYQAEDF